MALKVFVPGANACPWPYSYFFYKQLVLPLIYEIIATITDELGTRCVPTGFGSQNYADLIWELARLTKLHPDHDFHIEECSSQDAFNAY